MELLWFVIMENGIMVGEVHSVKLVSSKEKQISN